LGVDAVQIHKLHAEKHVKSSVVAVGGPGNTHRGAETFS
jgi:hypothetical protein